jgi:hypothetical protein
LRNSCAKILKLRAAGELSTKRTLPRHPKAIALLSRNLKSSPCSIEGFSPQTHLTPSPFYTSESVLVNGSIKPFQICSPKIPFAFPKVQTERHNTGTDTPTDNAANHHLKERSNTVRHIGKASRFTGLNPRQFELPFAGCETRPRTVRPRFSGNPVAAEKWTKSSFPSWVCVSLPVSFVR